MSRRVLIRTWSLSQYPDCARRVAANIFQDDIASAGFELRQEVRHRGGYRLGRA
jgi:hypothetical protein